MTLSCSGGGKSLELFNSDIQDWRITFARYRGIDSNIGQRLKAVEEVFAGRRRILGEL